MQTSDISITRLQDEVKELRSEVKELTASTKALVEAWDTATNVVKFVKLLASIVAAIGVIWFFVTYGFPSKGAGP